MVAILTIAALILLVIAPVYAYSVVLQNGPGMSCVELPSEWRRFRPSWREAIRGDRPSDMAAIVLLVVLILLTGPPVMLLYKSRGGARAAELLIFFSYAALIGGPVVLAAFAIIAARTGRARRLLKAGTLVDCFHIRNTVVSLPQRGSLKHGAYLYIIRNRAYRLTSQPLTGEPCLSPFSRTAFEETFGLNGRRILGRDLSHQEMGQLHAALKSRPKLNAAFDPDDPSCAVIVQGLMPANDEAPGHGRKVIAGYAILLVVLAGVLIGSAWNTLDASLDLALRERHYGIARLLLSLGADVNARKSYATSAAALGIPPELAGAGSTLPAEAVARGDLESLRFLVSHGADLHEQGDDGVAFVETAALHGNADMMGYLLDQGFDPLHRTHDGKTLLMLAAKNGESAELMRLLVERGAPVNGRDEQGNTALHYVPRRSTWLYGELVKLGADESVKNNNGKTPFEFHEQRSSRLSWPNPQR